MKKIEIYEPAMCCSTGICGPSIDSELLRISTVIQNLGKIGIIIERFNLSSNPQNFISNEIINEIINKNGVDLLPITLIDGKIFKTNNYITNKELSEVLEISEEILNPQPKTTGCGCKSGCC